MSFNGNWPYYRCIPRSLPRTGSSDELTKINEQDLFVRIVVAVVLARLGDGRNGSKRVRKKKLLPIRCRLYRLLDPPGAACCPAATANGSGGGGGTFCRRQEKGQVQWCVEKSSPVSFASSERKFAPSGFSKKKESERAREGEEDHCLKVLPFLGCLPLTLLAFINIARLQAAAAATAAAAS